MHQQGTRIRFVGRTFRALKVLLATWVLFVCVVDRGVGQSFSVTVDQAQVELGDSTVLHLTFADVDVSRAPQLTGITNATVQYMGPSRSIQIANGEQHVQVDFRYQLTPHALGQAGIPAFAFKHGASVLKSEPLTVGVVAKAVTSVPSGEEKLAFVRLFSPTNRVYEGEAFPIEVRLFSQAAENINAPEVALDGFVLGKQGAPDQGQTVIGRERYGTVSWRMGVHAVKPGELALGPAEIRAVLRMPSRNRGGFFDDGFFGMFAAERKPVVLRTATNILQVAPLPREGRLREFDGSVGRFTMEAQASPIQVRAGDPVTVKVVISGKGNLESITAPKWASVDGFRTYDAQSQVKATDALGLEGAKEFEMVIVPEREGTTQLPALSFCFFDPRAEKYELVRQDGIPIRVLPGQGGVAGSAGGGGTNINGGTKEADRIPQDPIQPMKVVETHFRRGRPWLLGPWGPVAVAVPWLVFAGWRGWEAYRRRRAMSGESERKAMLSREATLHSTLSELASAGEATGFYSQLNEWIQMRLGRQLGLPSSAITGDVVDRHLRPLGVAFEDTEGLRGVFERIEAAKYAALADAPQMERDLRQAEEICNRLDAVGSHRK